MRTLTLAILLAVASLHGAQLDSNTVTVTATRTLALQPDQVLFFVSLITAQDTGLDDVLAKLKGTGITAAQLNGVAQQFGGAITNGKPVPLSLWTFIVPVPFDKMKDTVKALTQLQAGLGSVQGAQALTFNVAGMRNSPEQLAAQPCALPALVSDARRQADAMAAAAGMRTGAIVSVSDGTSVDGAGLFGVPTAAARFGDFSQISVPIIVPATGLGSFISSSISIFGTSQPACSLTVQFKLLQ